MKIQVICIGKLKEKYWTDAVAEYMKRLSKYCDIEINAPNLSVPIKLHFTIINALKVVRVCCICGGNPT